MNDLTIFKNDRFGEIRTTNQYAVLGILSSVLSKAMNCSIEDEAWDTMHDVSKIGHQLDLKEFNDLYEATAEFLTNKFQKSEFYYHSLFNKLASSIIPGCTATLRKNDGHNFPDSWVKINGREIPVEIKLHNFGEPAVKQLERYMNAYNSGFGIAVGCSLTSSIHDNILFIPISELELCEKNKSEYRPGCGQCYFVDRLLGKAGAQ